VRVEICEFKFRQEQNILYLEVTSYSEAVHEYRFRVAGIFENKDLYNIDDISSELYEFLIRNKDKTLKLSLMTQETNPSNSKAYLFFSAEGLAKQIAQRDFVNRNATAEWNIKSYIPTFLSNYLIRKYSEWHLSREPM
jgi:hypothetical protein